VLFDRPAPSNEFQRSHVDLILASYRHWTGENLLGQDHIEDESLGERIFHAPFALVSHGTESDPIFNYANAMALAAFGYEWHEWIQLPSRYSAEAPNREARQKLLDEVRVQGFSDGYQGIRIGKNGRFMIRAAKVWNVLDKNGLALGQAAYFNDWGKIFPE
jgi:hypothetical protein